MREKEKGNKSRVNEPELVSAYGAEPPRMDVHAIIRGSFFRHRVAQNAKRRDGKETDSRICLATHTVNVVRT